MKNLTEMGTGACTASERRVLGRRLWLSLSVFLWVCVCFRDDTLRLPAFPRHCKVPVGSCCEACADENKLFANGKACQHLAFLWHFPLGIAHVHTGFLGE